MKLPDDNANIFATSLLILYCTFRTVSIILPSTITISFYILSKRFLKREELSDARVVSIIQKEYDFVVHFI